jgi:hypothetical protein
LDDDDQYKDQDRDDQIFQKSGCTMTLQKRYSPACSFSESPTKRSKSSSPDLNEDALRVVMEFLAPKELKRMAFTCKALRDTITTKLVMCSALMHGGHAGATVEILYWLMKYQQIHVPSALRLLRLGNGKICESCCSKRVITVRPAYGVFFCQRCLTERFLSSSKISDNPCMEEIVDHPCVAGRYQRNSKSILWARPSERNGEKCGPLVTFEDIEHMAAATASIDSMLSDLELPAKQEYEEFVKTYETSQADAKAFALYRLQKKESASIQAREKRIMSSLQIVSKIQAMLDEG